MKHCSAWLFLFLVVVSNTVSAAGEQSHEVFKAGEVAANRFMLEIATREYPDAELSRQLTDLDGYQVTLEVRDTYYLVTFSPDLSDGTIILGGGGQFKVAKGSLQITETTYSK